ncbi:phosphohydrolase [Bacteroidia bacterium]|nr:phosphohydrolase [Bacteroidia bacterium]
MAPEDIIKRYYEEGSKLHTLLLTHSMSVATKALEIARMHPEWKLDETFIREAALLHDIGIYRTNAPDIYCFGKYPYICHGYLGADLLRNEGLERHARVCERHTGSGITRNRIVRDGLPLPARDMLPETPEEKLICFADKFYSKSHPEKVKTVEKIRKSLACHGKDSVARWDEMVKLFYE